MRARSPLRRARRRAAVLALLLTAGACATGAPDHVRIGVVAPLSGPRAAIGQDLVRGAELAVDRINDRGGLLGADVELVVTDGADLVELPRRLADLAERARVSAVVGPEAPGVLVGPRSPLSRRGVPALLPSAFAGELGGASTLVARTVPSAEAQARRLAEWLVAERDVAGLAVLVADPVEGRAARDAIEAGTRAGGLAPTAVVEVDARGPMTTVVQALRRQAPDAGAVLLWGWPDAAARATLAVREIGWDVQIAVGSSAFVGEYRSLAGKASEGVVLPFPFRDEWFGPELTTWMLRYHSRHGLGALPDVDTLVIDVPVVAMSAYDAVGIVGEAVSRADSREPGAVATELETIEHDGLLRAYDLAGGEAWSAGDLHLARFHHLGVVYDVDPDLDAAAQRRFWQLQVSAEFLLDAAPEGPARRAVEQILAERGDEPPPDYVPPAPPPGPVGRP